MRRTAASRHLREEEDGVGKESVEATRREVAALAVNQWGGSARRGRRKKETKFSLRQYYGYE